MDRQQKITVAVVSVAIVTISVLFWWLGKTRHEPFMVVDARWRTETRLHQKTLMHDSGWGRPWDSGAFNVDCHRKLRDYEDCNCVMMPDTMIEDCDRCPVYDDWCEWDYYGWPVIKRAQRSGLPDETPTYEPLEAGKDQRLSFHETYEVLWVNEEKKNREYHAASVAELRLYRDRDWWDVEVNKLGMFRPVAVLTAER